MKTALVVVLFSLANVAFSYRLRPGPDVKEGESCNPFFIPDCGKPKLVSELATPAGDSYG